MHSSQLDQGENQVEMRSSQVDESASQVNQGVSQVEERLGQGMENAGCPRNVRRRGPACLTELQRSEAAGVAARRPVWLLALCADLAWNLAPAETDNYRSTIQKTKLDFPSSY